MIAPIDQVRGEGNCGRATDRGEEACECVRKRRPDFAAGRILTRAARLRTETHIRPAWRGEWAQHHEAVPSCPFR
jgi:hypothetical protein